MVFTAHVSFRNRVGEAAGLPGTGEESATSYRVLSAGAVRIGLTGCMDAFAAVTGMRGAAAFDTTPAVMTAVEDGDPRADVIVLPEPRFQTVVAAGLLDGESGVVVGQVFAGVVVREEAPQPDIAKIDALVRAVGNAEAVIYNRASSGRAVEKVLARLGLLPAVAHKAIVVKNGVAVVRAIAGGAHENAVGFAQSTEIRRLIGEGAAVRFVGPLPPGAGIVTRYMAGEVAGTATDAARRFLRFLAGDEGRAILNAAGVQWPPG